MSPNRSSSPTPRPKRTHDQVSFNGTSIDYTVRRSPRRKKTLEMRLEPDGLLISAPSRASDEEIRDIILKRAPWVLKKLAESMRKSPPRQFVTGETIPYLGRDVELIVEEGEGLRTQVHLLQGRFHVSLPPNLPDGDRRDSIRKALAAWYRTRAEEHISEEVDLWWPRFGAKKKSRVLIGNQRSQWGSCAPDGTLRFSWRTMMLSPEIIEYIVVHELSHLKVKDHSPKFWDVVARALPDVKRRRKLLRETGTALPL